MQIATNGTRATLAWDLARAIHDRCCRGTACLGSFEHLQEAAVAVDFLAGPNTASPAPASRAER